MQDRGKKTVLLVEDQYASASLLPRRPGTNRQVSDDLKSTGSDSSGNGVVDAIPSVASRSHVGGRSPWARPGDYALSRWRGQVGLGRLVIRDTLVIGSSVNLLTTIASLVAFSLDAKDWAAMLIFLSPVPYNVFLFACIWRLSGRVGGWKGTLAAATGAIWVIAATLL